ncbi:Serine/threonine-protein kinase, variant 2 [Puccinia graminis f. sp. tritici]|uniref:non-specific serine/threonine protein kinase n=2 Tax=Puccinia graminis f. sp. tritici TaxID=56615 RepID=A0A5B0MX07_PUCGR|nr:Serine/threonine-protein kinase, variant 2 [Puccinia graminis f. sp. tritici]KAA1120381.1 Serine/threonine-protein kinase [Puccinia graminis f. sp. tritici]
MGNAPSNNLNRPTGLTLDSFVSELGTDILYEKSLGPARFLKTIRARHKYGRIVVKVFVKTDPSFSLKGFVRRLKSERGLLQDVPNVLTYQRAVETEKAGYLIRQWLTNNLYDRISTRPFLSLAEKKWIAFQLLTAMRNSWSRGVPHGDLKSENVIVTSWNWIYITDFSSTFKPTYLPEDDPADFSYYFDTSSRRSCYLAPERFYSAENEIETTTKAKVLESMDVFGLGCVIGELFTEGSSPFTLSQMFNYKFGEYSVEPYLRGIEDEKIRDLVRSMIQLNPSDRLTFEEYLNNCQSNKTFPSSFYMFLHPFFLSIQDLSGPFNPPITPRKVHVDGLGAGPSIAGGSRLGDFSSHSKLRNDADGIIEKLWSDFEYISGFMGGTHRRKVHPKPTEGSGETVHPHSDMTVDQSEGTGPQTSRHAWADFPLRINVPGRNVCLRSTPELSKGSVDDDVALILLSVLNSNIRSCLYPNSVLKALDLYLALLDHLTDETMLDRVLPFLVSLLNSAESCDSIKTSTLLCLTQVLLLVDMITPSNSSLFPEYLIPNLKHLINDPSEFVRATLGKCIGPLALTSKRFLNLTQVINQRKRMECDTNQMTPGDPVDTIESSYDYNINELHRQFQEIVVSLLTDSSTVTKRSLLTSLPDLSKFFGRVKTNDILLAHILTYLNENDYILRTSFFEHMADIYTEIGPVSVEEYLLPMMMQALADSEEFVSTRVITALTEVIKKKLLSEHKLWELIAAVIVLLSHPNSWIRRASTELIVTVSHVLPTTDVWCVLYPALRKFLRCDIEDLTKQSILTNLEAPISRIVYEAAVVWAGRRQRSSFWQLPSAAAKKPPSSSASPSTQPASTSRQFQTNFPDNHALLSEDDTAQLSQLRKIGMTPVDEVRLKNMRQHIVKVADSRSRLPTPNTTLEASNLLDDNNVSLQDFGIPLHNILLKNPSASDNSNLKKTNSSSNLTVHNHRLPGSLQRKVSVDIPSSSTDPERPGTRNDSPTVTDLRRHLVTRNVMSPSIPGTPTPEIQTSRPQSCGSSTDAHPLGGLLERSSDITAKPILDSRNNVSSSKGFDVSKTNPATARDTTSVFGVLDTEARTRQAHVDFSGLGSQATEQMSSVYPHRTRSSAPPPQRFSSTYEGHDANIRYLLERVFLDSYREPLPEFGPMVAEGIPRRKAFRSFLAVKEKSSRSSSGNLIGHLIEHTAAVSSLCVSPDYVFFASGSHDGTVKVWDTVRLEKNVTSKSRHTFNQGGRITQVCLLEHSHCVASASTNGTLLVHRIDVNFDSNLPSYSKPEAIRQHKLNSGEYITSMIHYNTLTSSDLIYITNKCSIVTLDLRTMRTTRVLRNPKHFGPLSKLCIDQKKIWLAVGTTMGYLSLWDLRFGLLLKTWKMADGPIHQLNVHPTQGKGRWVVIAALSTIDNHPERPTHQTLQVWDLEMGKLVQTFLVSRSTSDVAVDRFRAKHEGLDDENCHYSNAKSVAPLPPQLNATSAIERLLQENQCLEPSKRQNILGPNPSQLLRQPPTVSSFIIGSRYHDNMSSSGELIMMADELNISQAPSRPAGYLISAGEDRRIRFWDLAVPERSNTVSGLEMEDDRPQFRSDASDTPTIHLEYIAKSYQSSHPHRRPNNPSRADGNPTPHRSTVVANYQQSLLRNHGDAVTAIAVIDLPFRCIVSADRTGVIHIYECKDRSRFRGDE